jgi:hypothetical protein
MSKDSFFDGTAPLMDSPAMYVDSDTNKPYLNRPMSKREFYQSIINFRTTVDTTLDDNNRSSELDKELIRKPSAEVPKMPQVSTVKITA